MNSVDLLQIHKRELKNEIRRRKLTMSEHPIVISDYEDTIKHYEADIEDINKSLKILTNQSK